MSTKAFRYCQGEITALDGIVRIYCFETELYQHSENPFADE